jgi:hypothetical protein
MNLKLVIGIAVVQLLFIFSNIDADDPESRLLFSISSQTKIRLGVINTSHQTLHLEISNKNGDTFLTQTTKGGTNYFQLFDVSKLPDGEYVINLTGLLHDIQKKFYIQNKKIQLKNNDEPRFSIIDGESLRILYNNPQGKIVTVVFELNNETIFEDNELKDIVINKKYSLKQMMKGNYILKLSVGDETFNYSFEIK